MPTLLSINNYHYRRDGSEAVYLDHNRMFESSGWDVVPFSMRHRQNLPTPWSEFFVDEIEFGQSYTLAEKMRRVPKVIYSLEARRKLSQLLRSVRPDIAHCHSVYHHLSPSVLDVLRKHSVPTVMTLHDFKMACPAYHMHDGQRPCEACKGGRIHNVLVKRCVKDSAILSAVVMAESAVHGALKTYDRSVDRFIAPCRFYIDKFVEWGWQRERFVHIPNFVDARNMTPMYSAGRAFLYFGRLSVEKGLLTLIRAVALAKVRLRIAGAGPQLDALRELAERVGADVTFLGHLTGRALADEVQESRATILASECYENAPVSILESFAWGKPVIGAAIGGIPELIEQNVTGWTFWSGAADDLAGTLAAVESLPDARIAEMGRAARSRAESEFSAALYQERIMDLYASLGLRIAA